MSDVKLLPLAKPQPDYREFIKAVTTTYEPRRPRLVEYLMNPPIQKAIMSLLGRPWVDINDHPIHEQKGDGNAKAPASLDQKKAYYDNFIQMWYRLGYDFVRMELAMNFPRYDRPGGDIPRGWIQMMKESMKMALRHFSSHRMVMDYMTTAYEPALAAQAELSADNLAPMLPYIERRHGVVGHWDKVHISPPATDRDISTVRVGETFTVSVEVYLGWIEPANASVEVYYGALDASGNITASQALSMDKVEDRKDGTYLYRQTVPCAATGRFGFTVRARPSGPEWRGLMPGLITWA